LSLSILNPLTGKQKYRREKLEMHYIYYRKEERGQFICFSEGFEDLPARPSREDRGKVRALGSKEIKVSEVII
jgi:hypothetical protein